MTDPLDSAFEELRRHLSEGIRLSPTHADPFFNFVHDPGRTRELHRRLPRWIATLEKDGWNVVVRSLSELLWQSILASGRWEDWMELEEPGAYRDANESMRDALREDRDRPKSTPGLARLVAPLLEEDSPRRVLFLTNAALLHPWFRVRTFETFFHDRIRWPVVLFYPGTRRGQFGLQFLGFFPEDGNYRSTIIGGQ